MKYIHAAAKAFAEMQWAETFPKEDIILNHPYWEAPTDTLKAQRDEWILARTSVWVHRIQRIRGYASAAETAACAWCIFLLLFMSSSHSLSGMDSLYFSHWFDLLAIPALVALDRARIYLIKDKGKTPSIFSSVLLRVSCVITGILFGFLSPLLFILTIITLLGFYHSFRRIQWMLSCF